MSTKVRIIIHALLAVALIAAGFAGFKMFKASREALGRQEPETPLPMVRTVPVSISDLEMTIPGEGTVRPVAEIQLMPQVDGKVVDVSPDLINGGTVKKGQRLVAIEADDYQIAVTAAEARVKDARSNYELARQEANAAREEWKQLHPDRPPPPLVAKKPQLEAAKANLEAARADLEKARLNLRRTELTAPFDGRVSSESVDLGQYVSPGQSIATLHSTGAAEIVVPMDSAELQWFDVPGFTSDEKSGAPAEVFARVAGKTRTWQGKVVRVEGKINEQTRMVNVVIRVQAPYATQPPLAIGQFAEVKIRGDVLPGAAIVPRAALHGENTVWVVDPDSDRLHFRHVDIARMDQRGVVVAEGLTADDKAVVSHLKAVTDGMKVRPVDAGANDGSPGAAADVAESVDGGPS
ncbi:MAG: efflux RND transporter periplasmic adaptor subunit [Thermodesulfobacteriota bacterium]